MTDKPKPFSAVEFLEFCRGKPAGETYRFRSLSEGKCGCALTQYFVTRGARPFTENDANSAWMQLHIRYADELRRAPHVFGALADRLEKAIADQGGKL